MNKITILLAVLLVGAGAFIVSQQMNKEDAPSSSTQNTTKPEQPRAKGGSSVDLSGQGLTSIPAEVISRTDISSLNLSNNQLTSLPADIGKLTNLQTLNVENNRLESLPTEIGLLKNLESADFGNNRLKSLPNELGNLSQLTKLNLSGYQGSTSDLENLKAKLTNTEVKY